ncbi:penicillin-binding transpeptidase domain-containing protein [Paenibacillus pini]
MIVRIFVLQVVQADKWHTTALKNWSKGYPIAATRGTISDRNGNALAIDAPAYTIVVNPRVIHANNMEDEVVEGLHRILNKNEDDLHTLLNTKAIDSKTKAYDYVISREVRNEGLKVDEATKNKVKEFSDTLTKQLKKNNRKKAADSGISFLTQSKRYYPKGQLAAHVLGFVDREGKAIMGLESKLDKELKGTPGKINYQSDGSGDKLPNPKETLEPAVNGNNYKLTIDDTIQYYIEDAMKEAYDLYKPISMTVIAADPKNMEILGLANLPTFDPNTFWESEDAFSNFAVRAIYEPGSTFKIVTLAGTIQEKLFNPTATYMSGRVLVKGTRSTYLHDINRSGWGPITYLEGVKRSSNVAFVKMGEMLGKDKLAKYIDDFGFGAKTGIELPGEITGMITLKNPVQTATASYGHGVTVTPIQQLAAISAIANGGKLLKPHIIKEMIDPNTGKTQNMSEPDMVRQVISPAAAKETSSYLEQVVSDQVHGTGRNAYIDGYRVAGKTGTAIKYTNGLPDKSRSVVSFIGFAPVNDPKIAMIIIMDEPDLPSVGGGTVAAPVFKKVVSQTLQYMGVPKTATKEESEGTKQVETRAQAPDLVNKGLKEAQTQLLDAGIAYENLGKGTKVMKQFPSKSTFMAPGQQIYLLTETDGKMEIPDLTGASLRDAMDILTLMNATVTVEGEGFVSSQKVENQNGKRVVNLTLQPAKEQTLADNSKASASTDASITDETTDTTKDSKENKSSGKKSDDSKNDIVKDTAGKNDH